MMLHRLVYYSRNRVPEQGPLDAEIRDILAVSRRNNAAAGVTGALMFNRGCFAQVLEGDGDAVEATFERIQGDERHGEVVLLALERVDRRAFGVWSMGFVGSCPRNAKGFAGVAAESGFDPAFLTGESVFHTLHRLALEEEGVA